MTLLIFFVVVSVSLMLSCGSCNDADPDCTAASEAVRQYYTCLIEGNNDEFVSSFVGKDSLPPDYRAALDSNVCDFMEVMNERHGGIKGVEVASASKDSVNNTIDVFLTLSYGDSTKTKIVVPMIKENEKWMMK